MHECGRAQISRLHDSEPRAGNQCKAIHQQPVADQIRWGLAAVADCEVGCARLQIYRLIRGQQAQINIGTRLPESRHAGHEPFGGIGHGGREGHEWTRRLAADGVDCRCEALEAIVQDGIQHLRGGSHGHPARLALEQPDADRLFQQANVVTDGSRRDVQLRGCALKAQMPRRGLEGA
jgi:hypothetical protein